MALLERGLALLDRAGGVAGDDGDVVEPGRLEVRERDVEDGPVAVDRHERLGQRVRVRREAPSGPRREHHPDHSASSSSSSYASGCWVRPNDSQLCTASATNTTASTIAAA